MPDSFLGNVSALQLLNSNASPYLASFPGATRGKNTPVAPFSVPQNKYRQPTYDKLGAGYEKSDSLHLIMTVEKDFL